MESTTATALAGISVDIESLFDRAAVASGVASTGVGGTIVLRNEQPTRLTATLYEPSVCVIVQGAKVVELGTEPVTCSAGQSIIVSHDIPIQSRIITATPDEPYLAIVVPLDLPLLRSLLNDVDTDQYAGTAALDVDYVDPPTIDACRRLLALGSEPDEISVLAPLITKELHFRLLSAGHGATLRALGRRDSSASRIAKAIAIIRADLGRSIAIADLARESGMSSSSFHEHFKAVTATTPLQYQKDLRLLDARRLLTLESRAVTETAFQVGYQSPSQFSREYARKFGVAPSDDRAQALA